MAMSQSEARQAAIASGASPSDVDAFIAKEGGARTSAQRITSAFGVSGSVGTDDLSALHAQKATVAGADASAKGTYLPGATPGTPSSAGGGSSSGGSGEAGAGGADTPPIEGLKAAGGGGNAGGGSGEEAQQLPGPLAIKQTLGNRIYPQESMIIANLRRAY